MSALKLMAKGKKLRGGKFDLFGRTEERRAERQLITDYKAMINKRIPDLTSENIEDAIELAVIAEMIKGFGHAKERNLEAAQNKWLQLG